MRSQGTGPRLLVVAGGPRSTASSRHRLWHYRPFLEADGVRLTWIEYGGGRPGAPPLTALRHRARFLRRLLLESWGHDVVLVQKVLPPLALVRAWQRLGARVVYDFDDALHEHFSWGESAAVAASRKRRFDRMLAAADHVVAGSPPLAAYAREKARDVSILYPALERDRFADGQAEGDPEAPVVGWIGNRASQAYLGRIDAVLARVLADHPRARFLACTAPRPGLSPELDARTDFAPWSETAERDAVASFDVAVSPLGDEPWSRSRGGRVSVLLSLAGGVPVVASPGGGLEELDAAARADGIEGGLLFASNAGAWEAHLRRLLGSPAERERRGRAARALVESRLLADVQYPSFRRAVLGDAVSGGEGRRVSSGEHGPERPAGRAGGR
ncbi:MAG: glycosyltransferase [Gemmatimonadetes bacterium]|nr:glycosyltransferase [Gemmatimonadota bacterium]